MRDCLCPFPGLLCFVGFRGCGADHRLDGLSDERLGLLPEEAAGGHCLGAFKTFVETPFLEIALSLVQASHVFALAHEPGKARAGQLSDRLRAPGGIHDLLPSLLSILPGLSLEIGHGLIIGLKGVEQHFGQTGPPGRRMTG